MSDILAQLGIDHTFFYELAIFVVLFGILSRGFFKPYLRLFEIRHHRTVEDRQAAERMMGEAQARLDEYKKRLFDERSAVRKDYEAALNEARKEEAALMAHAREEAKKITHQAAESAAKQQEALKRQMEADVETFAQAISERLLSRKV